MSNCIIYARTGQPNLVALNEQLYECTKSARRRGMRIVGVFTDEGSSKTGLAKAASALVTENIDAFIIKRADRISRDAYQCYRLVRMIRGSGCKIIEVVDSGFLSPKLDD